MIHEQFALTFIIVSDEYLWQFLRITHTNKTLFWIPIFCLFDLFLGSAVDIRKIFVATNRKHIQETRKNYTHQHKRNRLQLWVENKKLEEIIEKVKCNNTFDLCIL